MRVSLLESIQCAGYTETQGIGGDGACQGLTVPINMQGDFSQEVSLTSLTLGRRSRTSHFICHASALKDSGTLFAEPCGHMA